MMEYLEKTLNDILMGLTNGYPPMLYIKFLIKDMAMSDGR